MTKYHIGISRYIIHSILHLICRCFCFWVNAPFVLKITAIQKICSTKHYDGYYHHYYSTHNVFPLLSFIYICKKTPLLSNFHLDNKGGIFRGTTLYYYTCRQIQSLNTV